MIHYHGTPLTPRAALLSLVGRNFCVSYADPRDLECCLRIGQSLMLDNGAYSAWRRGYVPDWSGYYEWCAPLLEYRTIWAVIPDVIDGGEEENDALLAEWPHGKRGAPVWHLHEPIDRLLRLASEWPRVCLGSSGEYATVDDADWRRRMVVAMNALCGDGPPPCWLHMLRGLRLAGSDYPFASADSVNVARNYKDTQRDVRRMADEIDGRQCPARWRLTAEQERLFGVNPTESRGSVR